MRTHEGDETTSSSDLLERLRAGDPAAFELLYSTHREEIRRMARGKLGDPDDAEDLVQEVFGAVLRGISAYRGEAQIGSWIRGIARNRIGSALRSRRRERLVPLDPIAESAATTASLPDRQAEARAQLLRVQEALPDLTPLQREVFRLRHISQLSLGEIARRMGQTEGSVKLLVHRTRRVLAKRLGTHPT